MVNHPFTWKNDSFYAFRTPKASENLPILSGSVSSLYVVFISQNVSGLSGTSQYYSWPTKTTCYQRLFSCFLPGYFSYNWIGLREQSAPTSSLKKGSHFPLFYCFCSHSPTLCFFGDEASSLFLHSLQAFLQIQDLVSVGDFNICKPSKLVEHPLAIYQIRNRMFNSTNKVQKIHAKNFSIN